jgi:hypothetical protein
VSTIASQTQRRSAGWPRRRVRTGATVSRQLRRGRRRRGNEGGRRSHRSCRSRPARCPSATRSTSRSSSLATEVGRGGDATQRHAQRSRFRGVCFRVEGGVSVEARDMLGQDETRLFAPTPNSRLLSAEERACPRTTSVEVSGLESSEVGSRDRRRRAGSRRRCRHCRARRIGRGRAARWGCRRARSSGFAERDVGPADSGPSVLLNAARPPMVPSLTSVRVSATAVERVVMPGERLGVWPYRRVDRQRNPAAVELVVHAPVGVVVTQVAG